MQQKVQVGYLQQKKTCVLTETPLGGTEETAAIAAAASS